MSNRRLILLALSGCLSIATSWAAPTLFLIGDSTVRNNTRGQKGWGDPFAARFDPASITVANRAIGGRSSKTFLTEGRWDAVLKEIKPGDFLIMQFGHNDGGGLSDPRGRASIKGIGEETQTITRKSDGKEETVHSYGWYLCEYINGAKSRGAIPIVVSPVPRNIWKDGKISRDTHGYSLWARQVAEQTHAGFIPLHDLVADAYDKLGPEAVKPLFGGEDHTHTSPAGAELTARILAEAIRGMKGIPLGKHLLPAAARHSIRDHGAVGDGVTLDTAAIQKTIDAAARDGGEVEIPAGVFRSGALFLKPGVSLHIHKDGILLGSNDIKDYPTLETRIEGRIQPWRAALVNASQTDGLRIHGEGVIDGNGVRFWAQFWQRRRENPQCTNLEVERPRLMFIDRCNDVRIEGVALRYSGFWNLHLYKCRDVVVEGLSILAPTRLTGHRNYMTEALLEKNEATNTERRKPVSDNILGPSTDGIDIDSSQRVTIRKCYISVNDDNIALKGTKGPLADKDVSSPPVEDILIEDCEFGDGNGMLTCGSEATVVRNVTVRNCRITGDATMLTLKLRPDTPQHYDNILIEGIRIEGGTARFLNIAPWTQFFDLKGHAPPARRVSNVTIRDVSGSVATLGTLRGNPGDMIEDFTFENIRLNTKDASMRTGAMIRTTQRDCMVNGKPLNLPATSARL